MTARSSSPFPQPITGIMAALVVLAIVLFALPPTARLWVAAVIVTAAVLTRGKRGAEVIDSFIGKVYGK